MQLRPRRQRLPFAASLRRTTVFVVVALLATVVAVPVLAAPRNVALLPMLVGPGADAHDAQRIHGWLRALLAIDDSVALASNARLDRDLTPSPIAALTRALGADGDSVETQTRMTALRRGASLDSVLWARLDDSGDRLTLTLWSHDGGTVLRSAALQADKTGREVALDALRSQLHDAIAAWVMGRGRSGATPPPGVAVGVDLPGDAPITPAPLPASAAPAAMQTAPPTVNRPLAAQPRDPWGGRSDVRTNVYADNDGNRIVTPAVSVDADLSEKLAVSVHGALDIMTCASIDVLTAATPKGYFQETRRELGGGLRLKRDLASYSASVTGSRENDYGSISGAVGWSDEFAQRNTVLTAGYSFTKSAVGRADDPNFSRNLDSHTWSATVTQVLSPNWIVQASAWVGLLDGFQSSVYRFVHYRNGSSGAERMPSLRVRQAGVLALRGALTPTLFVAVNYRLYGDSWGLLAHTGEASILWQATPRLILRLRDRIHQQRGSPYYASVFERPLRFMSIDRELGALWGNLVGGKASALLLRGGLFEQLEFDLKVDGMVQRFADFPWLPTRSWVVMEAGFSATF